MTLNQDGIDLIKKFEGCRLEAYQDAGGIWTIGYGHTGDVHPGLTWTQQLADEQLEDDLNAVQQTLRKWITYPLNDNQFSAIVSLVYNIGGTRFKNELLQYVNDGSLGFFAQHIILFDHCDGEVEKGLLLRRQAERALFLKLE